MIEKNHVCSNVTLRSEALQNIQRGFWLGWAYGIIWAAMPAIDTDPRSIASALYKGGHTNEDRHGSSLKRLCPI